MLPRTQMPDIAALSVKVGYDDSEVQSGAARTSQTVSGLGSSIQSAMGAATLGAVAALGAGLVASTKTAMDFEKQMSAIGAVAGATTGEMKQLSDLTLQLGKDTSFSATEAAKGVEELIKAGVSIEAVAAGAGRAVLDLSAATGTAVDESARIMSNAMNVFKDSGLTAQQAANILAGAANASATSVHELGYAMAASGGVASMLGFTFEETSTALAMFADAGLRGSDAGTSFKTMMMNLIPQTNKEKDLMRELGLVTSDVGRGLEGAAKMGLQPMTQDMAGLSEAMRIHLGLSADTAKWTKDDRAAWEKLSSQIGLTRNEFFKIDGTIKPLTEVFETLKQSLVGMTKEQQISAIMTIFGTDATRAAAIANKMGAEGVAAMTEKMRKQGDVQKIANERLNNLAGSWEKFTGSVETGAIILGSMLLPSLKSMVDGATEGVNQVIEIIEQLPDAWRTVQQAFEGGWEPSETLTPFMNAVGNAGIMLRENFGPAIKTVGDFITGTLIPGFQKIAAPLAAFSGGFLATVAAAGLASTAIAAVASVLGLLLSPLGLVAVAVGLLAAAWTVNFGGIQEITAQFVAIVQQALAGDVAGAFAVFIALVGTTTQQIVAQLVLWGQAFVDWIAPMIPPMLAALATAAAALLAWISAQIPPLMAQLLLWGQEFVAWVAPQIPPLLAALAALGAQLLAWIAAQIPPIIAQLLLWGQQFVAWVAPQIPILLTNLGKFALAMIDWIIAQIPIITAKWVEIGILFGAWILTTAIPELVKALPGIQTTIVDWFATASVEVGKRLVTFGQALVQGIYDGFVAAWATIGPKIMSTIQNTFQLPSWMGGGTTTGTASQRGGYDDKAVAAAKKYGLEDPEGFAAQLRQESGDYAPDVVSGQRKSSAGATGIAQFMPETAARYGVDPTNPDASIEAAARYMADLKAQTGSQKEAAARYYGAPSASSMDGRHYLSSIEAKRGNVRVTGGPNGQMGDVTADLKIDQAVWASGMAGAAAICGPYAAAIFADYVGRPPTPREAAELGPQFGWSPTQGMMQSDKVDDMANEFIQRYNPGSGMRVSELRTQDFGVAGRTAQAGLTGGAPVGFNTSAHYFVADDFDAASGAFHVGATGTTMGKSGGSEWMTVAQIAAVGQGLLGVLTISGQAGQGFVDLGTQAQTGFGMVTQGGITAGQALVTTSTDALGNVTTIYQDATGVIGATITNAAGLIVNQWGTMATGVTEQSAAMTTGVVEQSNLMASGALTSVTDLGTGILTSVTTTSGTTIATVTDMQGQVTSQYATLANGAVLTMGDMAAGIMTSTTDLGTGVMTTVQDMSGNYITTITDLSGNVTAQYTQLATDVVAQTVVQSEGVQAETTAMSEAVLTSVTDLGDGVLTITQDTSGQMVATITDMAGNVTSTYESMGSDVTGIAQDAASAVVETFQRAGSEVTSAAEEMASSVTDAYSEMENVPSIDMSDTVKQLGAATKAAQAYQKALVAAAKASEDLPGKGGGSGGGGKLKSILGKAAGGPVYFGQEYLVGEHGPELFRPNTNGAIIPNHALQATGGGGGSMQTIRLEVEIGGRIAETIYVTGKDLATRRGRA